MKKLRKRMKLKHEKTKKRWGRRRELIKRRKDVEIRKIIQ